MRETPFTPIYEQAKSVLGISRDEYALCHYVQFWSTDPRSKKPGWCDEKKESLAKWVGITRPGLYKMVDRLENISLLESDPATGFLRITTKWLDTISNAKVEFNERKQSLQEPTNSVNKVYKSEKQSLQEPTNGVNKVSDINEGNSSIKEGNNVGGKPPAKNGNKKELHAPKWMVEAFEEIYEKEFSGIGRFNWQNKHFGENGLSGFYSRLSKRYLDKHAGETEAPQEALQKSWQEFLKIAASIEWIKKGFFTPTDLYNQFDKIGQEWKARQEKTKQSKAETNGATYTPSDIPVFIKRY